MCRQRGRPYRWAHLICVAAGDGVPSVIERRRVALIERGLPTQPYEHGSTAMREDEAHALIARVRRSIATHTEGALHRVVTELPRPALSSPSRSGSLRFPGFPRASPRSGRRIRLLCAADGMLYQLAICRAARQLGLDVQLYRRGDETSRAAEVLGVTPGEIEEFVTRTGRPAGPPWTQEHRRAYAAGIAALATHGRARLRLPR